MERRNTRAQLATSSQSLSWLLCSFFAGSIWLALWSPMPCVSAVALIVAVLCLYESFIVADSADSEANATYRDGIRGL
jgi:hypothetical protein